MHLPKPSNLLLPIYTEIMARHHGKLYYIQVRSLQSDEMWSWLIERKKENDAGTLKPVLREKLVGLGLNLDDSSDDSSANIHFSDKATRENLKKIRGMCLIFGVYVIMSADLLITSLLSLLLRAHSFQGATRQLESPQKRQDIATKHLAD